MEPLADDELLLVAAGEGARGLAESARVEGEGRMISAARWSRRRSRSTGPDATACVSVSETFAAALRERTSPATCAPPEPGDPQSERVPNRARPWRSCPLTKRRPVTLASAPASARRSAVRPEPTSPPRPRISPRRSVNEISSSTPRTLSPSTRRTSLRCDRPPLWRRLQEDVPEHGCDEALLRPAIDWFRRDELAVAHHRDPVAKGEHLVELVGDVDACDPSSRSSRIVSSRRSRSAGPSEAVASSMIRMRVVGSERPHDLEHLLVRC